MREELAYIFLLNNNREAYRVTLKPRVTWESQNQGRCAKLRYVFSAGSYTSATMQCQEMCL